METRLVEPHEAEALRLLRVRSVSEYPSAFGASVEEEQALTVERVRQQLVEGPPYAYWFGAFAGPELVGVLNLQRYQRPKLRHKTMLGGMYVVPERQGHGMGQALLQHTIAFAAGMEGVELISLAVTVGNPAARGLYLRNGFVPFGVDPRYIRVGDEYYDIEWMTLDLRPLRQA